MCKNISWKSRYTRFLVFASQTEKTVKLKKDSTAIYVAVNQNEFVWWIRTERIEPRKGGRKDGRRESTKLTLRPFRIRTHSMTLSKTVVIFIPHPDTLL
jgi:hypothetical protein